MFHSVIIYMWIFFGTAFFASLAIVTSLFDRSGDNVHRVARAWATSILWVSLVRVKVRGLSRLDPDRSYIYMANHQSNFDIPVLLSHLAVQFRWLAKAELFRIPVFGRSMHGAGYISIDRSNRESAFRSLKMAARIIREGTSVLIFPEGTRSDDGEIKDFKKGGFVLAVDSGVPIVPVIVHGTWPIMPRNRLAIRPGPVSLTVLPPVETSAYTRRTKNALADHIRERMVQALDDVQRSETAC